MMHIPTNTIKGEVEVEGVQEGAAQHPPDPIHQVFVLGSRILAK